jgi:hypothetical protein
MKQKLAPHMVQRPSPTPAIMVVILEAIFQYCRPIIVIISDHPLHFK